MRNTTKQPFVDNQRGATMRHKAHKAKVHGGSLPARLAITALIVGVLLFLTACASPYNHPGIPHIAAFLGCEIMDLFEGTEA